jgi:Protein of unknown function (DUF1194)
MHRCAALSASVDNIGSTGVTWIFRCVLPLVALVATQITFARAAEQVDLLLALAMDVSRSMDQSKFTMQREGYAAAISNPQVLSAIRSGAHQKIHRLVRPVRAEARGRLERRRRN